MADVVPERANLAAFDALPESVVREIMGRRSILNPRPAPPATTWLSLASDWTCEVLPRSDAATDRVEKVPFYARASVSHAWLVDPTSRALEAFRLEPPGWLVASTHAGDVRVRVELFDAVELDLSRIWA
ncbi:MAG: Uma2 family endonuclease [Acidobacteriota bacterium]